MNKVKRHLYHLVDESPWPLIVSLGALFFTMFIVFYTLRLEYSLSMVCLNLIMIILIMYKWWKDVVVEATYQGKHTTVVKRSIWIGFILFMVSEIMIFFVFFWGYFHYSLSISYEIGYYWPGIEIESVKSYRLPLFNTFILILSGITLTIAHKALLIGDILNTKIRLILTILLGLLFEMLQVIEYSLTSFNINDAVFGNIFYFLTGLHGFHVLVGIIFLIICLFRLQRGQLLRESHTGFEFAIWYWHFVGATARLFLINESKEYEV